MQALSKSFEPEAGKAAEWWFSRFYLQFWISPGGCNKSIKVLVDRINQQVCHSNCNHFLSNATLYIYPWISWYLLLVIKQASFESWNGRKREASVALWRWKGGDGEKQRWEQKHKETKGRSRRGLGWGAYVTVVPQNIIFHPVICRVKSRSNIICGKMWALCGGWVRGCTTTPSADNWLESLSKIWHRVSWYGPVAYPW